MIDEIYDFHKAAGTRMNRGINEALLKQTLHHLTEEMEEIFAARAAQQLPSESTYYDANLDLVDGFLDLAYVAIQGLVAMGLSRREANAAFTKVHLANWDKLTDCPQCHGEGHSDNAEYCSVCNGLGKCGAIRNEKGKIMKPLYWQPPKLEELLPPEIFEPRLEASASSSGGRY